MKPYSSRNGRSAARRVLSWLFSPPASPYICVNVSVAFDHAGQFLQQLNAGLPAGRHVTVQTLMVAAVARVLRDFPEANGRVLGRGVVRNPHVGVAFAVNLLGHPAGKTREVAVSLLERAESLSLQEMAETQRRLVGSERRGRPVHWLSRLGVRLGERAPDPLLNLALGLLGFAWRSPLLGTRARALFPFTTVVTNVGSVFAGESGFGERLVARGASVVPPARVGSFGTFWGFGAVQPEAVAVQGRPRVRPMLPVVFIFDHRLFDGVMAGRVLQRFAEVLDTPATFFGADGRRRPGAERPKPPRPAKAGKPGRRKPPKEVPAPIS